MKIRDADYDIEIEVADNMRMTIDDPIEAFNRQLNPSIRDSVEAHFRTLLRKRIPFNHLFAFEDTAWCASRLDAYNMDTLDMKTVRLLHRSVNIDGDRFSAGKLENVRLRLHGHIVATIKGRPTKVQFFTDLINELTSKNKKKIPAETISFLMSSMRDLVDGRDGRKISCPHKGKATRVRTLQKTDIQC